MYTQNICTFVVLKKLVLMSHSMTFARRNKIYTNSRCYKTVNIRVSNGYDKGIMFLFISYDVYNKHVLLEDIIRSQIIKNQKK